jgi:hypothetical protein
MKAMLGPINGEGIGRSCGYLNCHREFFKCSFYRQFDARRYWILSAAIAMSSAARSVSDSCGSARRHFNPMKTRTAVR